MNVFAFAESKFTMKLNRLFAATLALLSLIPAVNAQNESLAAIFTNADVRPVSARRPSIIYIQCNGLGYGDLSCYGQTNYQTPTLDRLAMEGVRFTNFRPDGTNFTSALAALMSGKRSGGQNAPNIAERLQAAGYRTGLVGEWTLGEQPWKQGFGEFVGFLNEEDSRNFFPERIRRFAPKSWTTESNTVVDYDGYSEIYENTGGKRGRYLPELLNLAACNFIRIRKPDEFNRYQPFFLLVNLPAPRSTKADADVFTVPSAAPYTSEKWPAAAKDRAALVTRLDGGVSRVLEKLREVGMTNDVFIFFSSSAAPEKFTDAKLNFLKPNGNAVASKNSPAPLPMIVWSPDAIRAQPASDFPWTSADFAPTALDIAYEKAAKDLSGKSITPALNGQTAAPQNR